MKERLVEDWLSRINEKGYQLAFEQILAAQGFTILRSGHSPYEHGKDVLAITPDGEVMNYQLKDGDIGINEWERVYSQVVALVETLPSHPALPAKFPFRPFLVTNGKFTDPALSRVEHHNRQWEGRLLPKLELIDGRRLHRELMELAGDFWPTTPADVREFRALYLVDGRGDFDVEVFAKFVKVQLPDGDRPIELERRSAALNVFVSYVLSEFYRQEDHWSVFRGWITTAARVACVAERSGINSKHLEASFTLAFNAARQALAALASECSKEDVFTPTTLEWDEYTRVRNTISLGAWATWCLMEENQIADAEKCIELLMHFIREGRLWFWGESCFSHLCSFVWLLERHGHIQEARELLLYWLRELAERQQKGSEDPMDDAYTSPEQILINLVETSEPAQIKSVHSRSLLPLVCLLVNRNCREELAQSWIDISNIVMTVFKPDEPAGYLDWHCERGQEIDQSFQQPQSWAELVSLAATPPVNFLPQILRENISFKRAFLLGFPHRLGWSLIGSLDLSEKQSLAGFAL